MEFIRLRRPKDQMPGSRRAVPFAAQPPRAGGANMPAPGSQRPIFYAHAAGGALFSLVCEGEILELKLLRARAGVAEALVEEVADEPGLQVIEIVLAVAAITHQPGPPHD